MERRDARKLNKNAKEEIRRQAINVRKSGLNNTRIAKAVEVHRSTEVQQIVGKLSSEQESVTLCGIEGIRSKLETEGAK